MSAQGLTRSVKSPVGTLADCSSAPAAESTELDQFEDKCIARAAERALKAAKSDRVLWAKALEAAFPGKVTDPTTPEEYESWYALLVGKNDEWRRADAPKPARTRSSHRDCSRECRRHESARTARPTSGWLH